MTWRKISTNVFAGGDYRIERLTEGTWEGHYRLTNVNEGYWFTHPTLDDAQQAADRLAAVPELLQKWEAA